MLDPSQASSSPTPLPAAAAPGVSRAIVAVRVLAFVFAIVIIHWADSILAAYFILLAAAAALLAVSLNTAIPGLRFLEHLDNSDRLAACIVLVVAAIIGCLHNANTWRDSGLFNRPQDIALWKTELILGISLAAPLAHWLASRLLPRTIAMNGRRFAAEFALYVNFSGIALALWTGEAVLSWPTFGAALALMVLAELTLYAGR